MEIATETPEFYPTNTFWLVSHASWGNVSLQHCSVLLGPDGPSEGAFG